MRSKKTILNNIDTCIDTCIETDWHLGLLLASASWGHWASCRSWPCQCPQRVCSGAILIGEGKLKENNIMHTFLIQITYPLGWQSLAPTCFCNLSLESAKPRTPQTCLKHVSNMCQQLVACIAELSISQLFRITFRTDQPSPIARLGHSWTSERLNCWSQQLRTARQSNVPT